MEEGLGNIPKEILFMINDHQGIKETNYWDTEAALGGKFFFSVNGGCIRMLVPDAQKDTIPDIKSGVEVIISRGPWPAMNLPMGYEFLFEDFTDAPMAIQVGIEQWDLQPEKDQKWVFSAYTREGKFHECCVRFRDVTKIPCLQAWKF